MFNCKNVAESHNTEVLLSFILLMTNDDLALAFFFLFHYFLAAGYLSNASANYSNGEMFSLFFMHIKMLIKKILESNKRN